MLNAVLEGLVRGEALQIQTEDQASRLATCFSGKSERSQRSSTFFDSLNRFTHPSTNAFDFLTYLVAIE